MLLAGGVRHARGGAHTADHAACESALHAAVAEELNLRTAAVKAAFEANHPARRGAKRRPSARGRAPRRPVAACYD